MAGRVEAADFLVEIGTEELPPQALPDLMRAFAAELARLLDRERLAHGEVQPYATPRRLAVLVRALARRQEDREIELKGPPVAVAFDAEGKPTAAARAFAERCGVAVEALGRIRTGKGEWLAGRKVEEGSMAEALLPGLVEEALAKLPIPRRMRWGDSEIQFVRPVHWVLMLHGEEPVPGTVLGLPAGRITRGHRFHASGELAIPRPAEYAAILEREGRVVADFAERRRRVVEAVERAAAEAGGRAVADDTLIDEVTSLTEWPVALVGRFDAGYLDLPREIIVATITHHQRYFPVEGADGKLKPEFVIVANLESRDPAEVRAGNERVIRPRLADAAFFREQDRQLPLPERLPLLENIVYSDKLGTLHDKSRRVAGLAAGIARQLGVDAAATERAALLARCDLTTGIVGEFPELQGIMGGYYARDAGEPEAVARAIPEMYRPRHAGDALPATGPGRALSLADRLDTLAGHFAAGSKPTGNRDPYGLRRAAQGIVRLEVEGGVDLELPPLIGAALEAQPVRAPDPAALAAELYDFVVERLRAWYLETRGTPAEVFEAVRARRPGSLVDFDLRLAAVTAFVELDAAASLAAANKRIANILRQAGGEAHGAIDQGALAEPAEQALARALEASRETVAPLIEARAYTDALQYLAGLREPVDRFFDEVLVMSDDPAVRENRLALLASLRALFLEVADVSRLALG
ncbi:MAG TPA: glycine--tRNA ligase subunit beta [Woeseiaceae bacterium]|nr:glycine--tRNA ligase subunit beta [Woeseiaceae bacterium]